MQKQIEIDYPHDDGTTTKEIVTIKKMSYGERNKLLERMVDFKVLDQKGLDGKPMIEIKPRITEVFEQPILLAVVKAPWQVDDISAVRALDTDVAELVYKEIDSLNKLEEAKKSLSAVPMTTGQTTESSVPQ